MKRILLLLLLVLLPVVPTTAKTISKITAVVNNDIITTYQLEKAVVAALSAKTNGSQLTPKEFEQLRVLVLERLINEKLVEQRIVELGLEVAEPELAAAIEDVQRKNNLTRSMLEQALKAQGMTFDEYREQLKKELLRYKLLGREVNYKVQVTSSEVRSYFREHIEDYSALPQVRVSNISFQLPADVSTVQMNEIRQQADDSRDRLLKGEEFEKVLAGQGETASGGDMGKLVLEELTPQLQEVLAGLEVGQVSELVVFNNQLHLFLITARDPGDKDLYDRVKYEIEELLVKEKTEVRFREWAKELRDQGHVEVRI